MDHAFVKKIEASVADALLDRIKAADDAKQLLEDLERLRRFAISDANFRPRFVAALGLSRNSELLDSTTRESLEVEWQESGAQTAQPEVPASVGSSSNGAMAGAQTHGAAGTPPPIRLFTKVDAARQGLDHRAATFTEALCITAADTADDEMNPWTKVAGDDLVGFLAQITPIDGNYIVDPTTTHVAWRFLPFYDQNCALVRVADAAWHKADLVIYFLTLGGNLFRLNGTAPPIHEVNAKAPIRINDDNVLDYLRFFCFFVRGEEGPFYIAESLDDPLLPEVDLAAHTPVVAESFVPAVREDVNEQGHYPCNATVFYANAVFKADFVVQPTGMIEMRDDDVLAADLPGQIELPLS